MLVIIMCRAQQNSLGAEGRRERAEEGGLSFEHSISLEYLVTADCAYRSACARSLYLNRGLLLTLHTALAHTPGGCPGSTVERFDCNR